MHGQYTWYELTTPDVDAAKQFYPRFTGWGTQPFDDDYTMWTSGGVPVAGLFRLSDEMRAQGVPPNWMAYVEADDVDATAAQAASLGGQVVHGPADIPGAGRFAVLQDPHGATFGIYKSSGPSSAWDGTPAVGRFSWHELMTTDVDEALEFYGPLFGWEKVSEMDMGNGEMYVLYGKNGTMYGGMFNRPGEMESMPPFWLLYIHVPDVGKAVDSATKAGGRVHRPQMDIPGGSIAILGDPHGAGFALHHVSAPAAEPARAPARKKSSARKKAAPARKKAPSAGKKAAPARARGTKAAAKKKSPKKSPKLAAKRKGTGAKARTAARTNVRGKAPAKTKARAKSKATARKATPKTQSTRSSRPARPKSKARARKR